MAASYQWAKALADLLGEGAWSDWLMAWVETQKRKEDMAETCAKAMRRAKFDPANAPLLLTDIGLLAYRAPENPKLHRLSPIVTDTRWLRPFVEFEVRQRVKGTLTLQIINQGGKVVFSENQAVQLRGTTRVIAQNWLPLQNLQGTTHGRWVVLAGFNGERVAIHPFEWVKLVKDEILELVREDGEISPELEREVKFGKFRRMTLDELLQGQED